MKKRIRYIAIFIFLMVCFPVFSEDSVFNFHWTIGTAAISYGDSQTKTLTKNLSNDDFTRLVLSGELGLSIKLDKSIRFMAGGNLVYDSYIKGSQSAFLIDYAIFGGIRIYPGLGGFNLGLEYNTGRRSNFYNLNSSNSPESYSTNWGNGFRFVTEYDFSFNTEGLAPVVGISYRRMPRGGFADNIFSFYFRLVF